MKTIRGAIITCCLFCITGCYYPAAYYKPSAIQGRVVSEPLHVNEIADLESLAGPLVHLNATLSGTDTILFLAVAPRTNKWMRFTSDIITISDTTGHLIQEIRIPKFDRSIQTKAGLFTTTHGALDRLDTPVEAFKYCNFSARMIISDCTPKKFVIGLPRLIVDGRVVEFLPVTFELRMRMQMWTDGP